MMVVMMCCDHHRVLVEQGLIISPHQMGGEQYADYNPQWLDFDVTSGVQAMKDGFENNGWRLIVSTNERLFNIKMFHSSEYTGNTALRPKLVITYTTSSGGNGGGGGPGNNTDDLTLYLQERLSEGVVGLGQDNAVAMFGVPFLEGDLTQTQAQDIKLVDAAGVEIEGSTEPYALWPDDSVRWLRVIAQADVLPNGEATQIGLEFDTPSLNSSTMIMDSNGQYQIDTGEAVFTIGQSALTFSGPNISDLIVYAIDDGQLYQSNGLTSTDVEIDSPVMAQIRIRGAISNTNGDEHVDYTLRLRFTKHQSMVNAWVRFTNGRESRLQLPVSETPMTYDEMGISLVANTGISSYTWNEGIGSVPSILRQGMIVEPEDWAYNVHTREVKSFIDRRSAFYTFAYTGGWDACATAESHAHREEGEVKTYSTPTTASCRVIPAHSAGAGEVWVVSDTAPEAKQFVPNPSRMGVTVQENGQTILTGNKDNQNSLKWLEAGPFAVAVDLMPAMPASGYRVNANGALDILLYGESKRRTILWGEAATYRLGFDTNQLMSGEDVYHRVTWPVWGRASWERYRDTGAIFGQTELLDDKQEEDFWLITTGDVDPLPVAESPDENMPLSRWSAIYYRRNYREEYIDVVDALKTGTVGGKLQTAIEQVRYYGDKSMYRTVNTFDNWDFGAFQPSGVSYGTLRNNRNLVDCTHQTMAAMVLLGYTTTEPWLAEVIQDYGEFLLGMQETTETCTAEDEPSANMRVAARTFRDRLIVIDFLKSIGQEMNDLMPWGQIERIARRIQQEYPTSGNGLSDTEKQALGTEEHVGQSINRGYYYGELGFNQNGVIDEPIIHTFFMEYWGDSLSQAEDALQRLGNDTPEHIAIVGDFYDTWTGVAQFMCGEALFDNVSDPHQGGISSVNLLDYFLLTEGNNYPGFLSQFFYTYAQHAINKTRRIGYPDCQDKATRPSISKTIAGSESSWYRGKLQVQRLWFDYLSLALAGKSLSELQAMRGATTGASWDRLPISLTDIELQDLVDRYADFPLPAATWNWLPSTASNSVGNGQRLVTWSAPSAEEVEIRCADKMIVPWLNFDRDTRLYEFDPATHIAWFAAEHIEFFDAADGQATVDTTGSHCTAFAR